MWVYLDARDYVQIAASFSLLAWDLGILGFADQAADVSQEVLTWANAASRADALAVALGQVSNLDQIRGDVRAALDHSMGALSISAEYGLPHLLSMDTVIQGWARSSRGEAEEGMAEMRRGIADSEAVGIRAPSFLLFPLAETCLRMGHIEEAGRLLTAMLETVRQTGHRLQEAELSRLKGELLRQSSDSVKAEACFRQAIAIARAQSAKWWELRATTSLARLLCDTNRGDEARAMLTEIYNWFTEGFDTADLKEAKALLDELSA